MVNSWSNDGANWLIVVKSWFIVVNWWLIFAHNAPLMFDAKGSVEFQVVFTLVCSVNVAGEQPNQSVHVKWNHKCWLGTGWMESTVTSVAPSNWWLVVWLFPQLWTGLPSNRAGAVAGWKAEGIGVTPTVRIMNGWNDQRCLPRGFVRTSYDLASY